MNETIDGMALAPKPNDIQWQHGRQENKPEGQVELQFSLTAEQYAILEELFSSRGWKVYRQILIASKEGYQTAMLPLSNPNQALKELGIVCGLNLAINNLTALVATGRAVLKKEDAKRSGPVGRKS